MLLSAVDALPGARRLAGTPLRPIPLGVEAYESGLVAADRLPAELTGRVRAAVAAALERQREDPEAGLAELLRRYPGIDPSHALEGWSLVEPYVFAGAEPGGMDVERWRATVAWAGHVYGFHTPPAEDVFRTELAAAPAGAGPPT